MSGYTPIVSLSTREVSRVSGASYRQIDWWARVDALVPSIADAQGSGSFRRYSIEDAALARLIFDLSNAGIPLRTARRAVDVLRGDAGAWDTFLVIVDGAVISTDTPGAVLADARTLGATIVAPAAALVYVQSRLASEEVTT